MNNYHEDYKTELSNPQKSLVEQLNPRIIKKNFRQQDNHIKKLYAYITRLV